MADVLLLESGGTDNLLLESGAPDDLILEDGTGGAGTHAEVPVKVQHFHEQGQM